MKQIVLIFGFLLILACSSCYRSADNNPVPANQVTTKYLSVGDWVTGDFGLKYDALIDVPYLDDHAMTNNGVTVDINFSGNNTHYILPQIINQVYYSCEYTKGQVRIIAYNYASNTVISNPGLATIKVVVIRTGTGY